MSSEYKLHYFGFKARAEVIRLIFKLADQDFIDNRIPMAQWPELKPSMPAGEIPVLEHKGVQLAETTSIARYVARELGLNGSNSIEQAICDTLMEMSNAVIDKTRPIFYYCQTEEEKEPHKEKLRAFLKQFEAVAARYRKPGCKFVLGDKPTLADAAIFAPIFDFVQLVAPDCYPGEDHPTIVAIIDNFSKVPNIVKWIKERPEGTELKNKSGLVTLAF